MFKRRQETSVTRTNINTDDIEESVWTVVHITQNESDDQEKMYI